MLVAGLILLAGPASLAVDLVEGVNYKPLKPAQPTSVAPGKVEVVEVFWYACGHCYLLEPKLAAWERKGKAANIEVVRLPATWNEMLKTHARLFYTIEILGKPELHDEAFREMNVRGNRLDTPDKIEAFFVSRGVGKAEFQKAFSGFAVETKLARAVDLNQPLPHHQHADRDRERPLRHGCQHGGRRRKAVRADQHAGRQRKAGD